MKDKIYYKKEEVLRYVHPEHQEEFQTFGFNCIWNFCETSNGWVASFEDCCPYCVHIIIKTQGTKEDKEKFNSVHDLGESYDIPLTRKDIALDKKKNLRRKTRSGTKRRKFRGSRKSRLTRVVQREKLENVLKLLRKDGINILRRGKNNIYKNLKGVMLIGEFRGNKGLSGSYLYFKDMDFGSFTSFLCISSEDELLKYAIKTITKYNEDNGTTHKVPTCLEDLVLI